MWTFVPKDSKRAKISPLCCLKNCTAGNPGSGCPGPEVQEGVTSGVKDPSTYGMCKGPTCFAFDVDWSSGGPATTLPGCPVGANATPTCGVRKLEAVYYPPDGRTYACPCYRYFACLFVLWVFCAFVSLSVCVLYVCVCVCVCA